MRQNVNNTKAPSSFQLRLFISVLLLASLIVMEKNNLKVAGITAEYVRAMISTDFEDRLEGFAKKIN